MATENNYVGLSPTVINVLEQFTANMRTDTAIQEAAINQLEKLLQKGIMPKFDEINDALFNLPADGVK